MAFFFLWLNENTEQSGGSSAGERTAIHERGKAGQGSVWSGLAGCQLQQRSSSSSVGRPWSSGPASMADGEGESARRRGQGSAREREGGVEMSTGLSGARFEGAERAGARHGGQQWSWAARARLPRCSIAANRQTRSGCRGGDVGRPKRHILLRFGSNDLYGSCSPRDALPLVLRGHGQHCSGLGDN